MLPPNPHQLAQPLLPPAAPEREWNGFLCYLILLLYSLADQFSSSNYCRNGRIRIGGRQKKNPEFMIIIIIVVLSSISSDFIPFLSLSLSLYFLFYFFFCIYFHSATSTN